MSIISNNKQRFKIKLKIKKSKEKAKRSQQARKRTYAKVRLTKNHLNNHLLKILEHLRTIGKTRGTISSLKIIISSLVPYLPKQVLLHQGRHLCRNK